MRVDRGSVLKKPNNHTIAHALTPYFIAARLPLRHDGDGNAYRGHLWSDTTHSGV